MIKDPLKTEKGSRSYDFTPEVTEDRHVPAQFRKIYNTFAIMTKTKKMEFDQQISSICATLERHTHTQASWEYKHLTKINMAKNRYPFPIFDR